MKDQSIKSDEIVEALRAISTKNSISTYKRSVCKDAAALIERQAAQLAIMTAERDGLQAKYDRLNDFERTQSAKLLARLGTVEAERDAAAESWRGFCSRCEWRDKQYLADGKMDDRCKTCRDNHKCNWKWRGPQGAGEVV